MKRILALVLILSLLTTAGAALASDVSAALYRGLIRITNSGNTTASAVSTNMTLDSTSFIASGFCNDNMTDIAIQVSGTDTAFMPGYGSNPWVVWVETIGGNQNTEFDLYSSGATGGKIRYFPDTGGMTTLDSASLELGDNWTIEQKGWIDTSYPLGSANLTSPTSRGDPDSNWTGDFNTFDENTGTYAISAAANHNLELIPSAYINTDRCRIYISSSGTNTWVIDFYYEGAWHEIFSGALAKSTWVTKTNGAGTKLVGKARVRTTAQGVNDAFVHEFDFYGSSPFYIYKAGAVALYNDASGNISANAGGSSLNAIDVSSDEHTVTISANITHLWIEVDGSVEDITSLSANVTDTSDNWTFCSDNATPYMEYLKITIDGVLQQHIVWQYSDNFTDLSGNGHHATPTFRTTSSDSDVSANLTSFGPVTQARVEGFSLTTAISILTGIPSMPENMYGELDFTNIPGAEAANVILDEGDTPYALWWFILIYMAAVILGFIAYGATRLGGANGSLLTQFIVMEVIIALVGIMGPVPFWPAILFPIAGTAIILSQKHFSWG